jgi:hypothetical protein
MDVITVPVVVPTGSLPVVLLPVRYFMVYGVYPLPSSL